MFNSLKEKQNLTRRAKVSLQGGFTIMELMISMAIFLVAGGAMLGLMNVASKSGDATSQRTELLKNARTGMTTIGRDIFNAGYSYPTTSVLLPDNKLSGLIGVPNDIDNSRDLVAAVSAGKEVNTNGLETAAGVISGRKTDQITMVYQDNSFNRDAKGVSQPLQVSEPSFIATGTPLDEIVPLAGNDAAACRPNDIVLVTGSTSAAIGVITSIDGQSVRFAGGDVLGFNNPNASELVNPMRNIKAPTTLRRISLVTYKVTHDGALVRTVYGNNPAATLARPSREEPLVYGVEDMKVEYVLHNGTVTRNPIAGPDETQGTSDDVPANQYQVRQVRVTLTVQSQEKQANGSPYRVTLTSVFETRNLGYAAA
jgi:prepilin-type N-terminal cleavage/methylation domain-containing protein